MRVRAGNYREPRRAGTPCNIPSTLMVRLSASWAVMASSETDTARIAGSELITMLIRSLHDMRKVRLYQATDLPQPAGGEAPTCCRTP